METHLPTPSCQGPWGKNLAWPEPFCGCRAHGFTLGRSQLAPAGGIGENELEISQMMGTVYIYKLYINYIYIYVWEKNTPEISQMDYIILYMSDP